jgi:heme/copper-type cytochrome/quinol oxidase subunit 4
MDGHRGARTLVSLSLLALAILAGPAPALAHGAAAPVLDLHHHPIAHSSGVALPPWALLTGVLLGIGLTLLAGLVAWRRADPRARGHAVALALSLLLTVFAVEAAVHSVHHLADRAAAADCSVLASSQHLAWGAADPVDTGRPQLDVTAAPLRRSEEAPRGPLHRPVQGRAPPA